MLLDWAAAPSMVGRIGTVKAWKEVGYDFQSIDYEYLMMFDNIGIWVPSRYLRRL